MSQGGKSRTGLRCPICGAAPEAAFRPFCSRRCADLDLHRWMTGQYTVPVVELDEDEIEALIDAAEDTDNGDDGAAGDDREDR